jgi:hypothetical protein
VVTPSELSSIRDKLDQEPYASMMTNFYTKEEKLQKEVAEDSNVYSVADLLNIQSILCLITDEPVWAEKAWNNFMFLINDTVFVQNHLSTGLTRGSILYSLSISYDFCFNAWEPFQRKKAAKHVYDLMVSVNSNMGYFANYAMESNWMGVRYGTVLLAACVLDDYKIKKDTSLKPRSYPFLWDALKRLNDHMTASLTSNGWHLESKGYHFYDWKFSIPGILALQQKYHLPEFQLGNYVPKALHSLRGIAISTVNIHTPFGKGVQPDFSDNGVHGGMGLFNLGLAVYPGEQIPYIKWMHEYLYNPETFKHLGESLFYAFANYPGTIQAVNPKQAGWNHYFDKEMGVAIFRNRYKNENDIVAAFKSTNIRPKGHQGADNLGFRIIGLENIWVPGGGRTNWVKGQTTLFPHKQFNHIRERFAQHTGEILSYHPSENGSGYVTGKGSCMGTRQHKRYFHVDYTPETGAEALFIVADSSENGRYWRLNTPEFNTITLQKQGFTLTAPNQSTLKAVVLQPDAAFAMDTGKVRYGGETVRHNPGICYHQKCYSHNKYIDIRCNKNIVVVMTLQKGNRKHPEVKFYRQKQKILVGQQTINLNQ